uniref:Putative kunitz-like peptide n=1 Tax=Rhipicephalus pulchellus TaxID=72859 RepID=L7MC75_RHIPC
MCRTSLVLAFLLVAFVASVLGKRGTEENRKRTIPSFWNPHQGPCRAYLHRYYCMANGCNLLIGCYTSGGYVREDQCKERCRNGNRTRRPRPRPKSVDKNSTNNLINKTSEMLS